MQRFLLPISLMVTSAGTAFGVPAPAPAEHTPIVAGEGAGLVATRTPSMGADFDREADGLFYVNASVNGRPIRFLIDTGATVVMLTRADAAAVGIQLGRSAFRSRLRTANGTSAMAWAKLYGVSVAGQRIDEIEAAVPESGLPVSLLGQNLLAKLGPITIDGDRLRVHGRPTAEAQPL